MSKDGLRWDQLKNNRCAKCLKDLALHATVKDGILTCDCGFSISEVRFAEIISDRVSRAL